MKSRVPRLVYFTSPYPSSSSRLVMHSRKRRTSDGDSSQDDARQALPASAACHLAATTSSSPQEQYSFFDRNRESTLLQGFKELFDAKQLFDLTLVVGERRFQCHRALLAGSSDYFRAMFAGSLAESGQDVVTINGVDPGSMELVVDYLYSGRARLSPDNVQSLLSAANLLQLRELRDGCASYMGKKLDIDNCVGIHFFAQAHECETLEYQAWDVISENFDAVCYTPEFLDLSALNLIEIIKYDDIQATEEEVFEACLRWLEHRYDERRASIFDVFSQVRFVLIDEHYFCDKVRTDPFLESEPCMRQTFELTLISKLLKNRLAECDARLEPRYGSRFCRVVVYTAYMDDEKKQVLQLYGQRCDEVTPLPGNVLCDLPNDLENPVLIVSGDNELFLTGIDGSATVLYRWLSEDNAFEELASIDNVRKQFGMVRVDDVIYILGGSDETGFLPTLSKYINYNETWEDLAYMPKGLRCFAAVALRGKLYVFGGECQQASKKVTSKRTCLNKQTFCYDTYKDKWSTLADIPTPRALLGAAVFKNKIYVIGGFSSITDSWMKDKSPENCVRTVEIYDPDRDCWETGPDLPVPLCAMGVVKYYGTIYLLGGETENDVSTSVYFLNQDTDKWEHKDEMVTGVTETTIHSSYAVISMDITEHELDGDQKESFQ